jgi:hypothetical protein
MGIIWPGSFSPPSPGGDTAASFHAETIHGTMAPALCKIDALQNFIAISSSRQIGSQKQTGCFRIEAAGKGRSTRLSE